jgi:predicted dinucleotide-binding enzyme
MKFGVLGSGDVARTLASGFLKHGHDVMVGSREPGKLGDWAKDNPKGKVGTFMQAAQFAQAIVLAVKGSAASAALKMAGVPNLAGKTIIDATNPIADAPPVNGVLKFYTTLDDSQLERLQKEFPAGNFVKAFNSVGAAEMVNPRFATRPTMFICGNDAAAKKMVTGVLEQLGWETADMGKAESARAIEPLCMLWCIRGFNENKWDHAFKLLM